MNSAFRDYQESAESLSVTIWKILLSFSTKIKKPAKALVAQQDRAAAS